MGSSHSLERECPVGMDIMANLVNKLTMEFTERPKWRQGSLNHTRYGTGTIKLVLLSIL